MHKADRITAALLLALAVAFSAGALKFYPYSSESGPGSGFVPFWVSAVMTALALLMLFRRPRPADVQVDWKPRGAARMRVLAVIGITVAFVALLKVTGMVLGTALYLAVVMRYVGRVGWITTLAVSVGVAGVNYLIFAHWLRVPFPQGWLWTF